MKVNTHILISCFLLTLSACGGASPSNPPACNPFGLHPAFLPPKRAADRDTPPGKEDIINEARSYDAALDLGIGWERCAHPVLAWNVVQSSDENIEKEVFDWSIPDSFIRAIPPSLDPLVTISVGKDHLKPNTWQFRDESLLDRYRQFVAHAVERYNGDGVDDMPGLQRPVRHWQIENEPEMNGPPPSPYHPPEPNLDWQGYRDILVAASRAIRSRDGQARVLSAGMGSYAPHIQDIVFEGFYTKLISELPEGTIDIFDIHWFGPWQVSCVMISKVREVLNQYGMGDVSIWVTECGSDSRQGEENQAADLVRRLVVPLTCGAERIAWAWGLVEGFPPFTGRSMYDHTGLIYDGYHENDHGYGQRKAAFYTYRKLIEELGDADFEHARKVDVENENVFVLTIPRPRDMVYLLWRADDEIHDTSKVSLPVLGPGNHTLTAFSPTMDAQSTETDLRFDTISVEAVNGNIDFEFDGRPVLIECIPEEGESVDAVP